MAPPALIGKVTSDREGAMEGVRVRAKKPAGKITVTVASDANGDYAFPVDRLEGGRYELTIRAAADMNRHAATAAAYPQRTTRPSYTGCRVSISSSARLIGKLAATARSQNPFTSAASGSPRRPALASHAFNALMSSSAIMLIPDVGP